MTKYESFRPPIKDDPIDPLEVGANPGLYASVSKPPRPDVRTADNDVTAFLREVAVLRVKHRIPEVLVLAAVHFEPSAENPADSVAIRGIAYGHPDYRAQLGAMAFNTYTLPVINQADALRALAMQKEDK